MLVGLHLFGPAVVPPRRLQRDCGRPIASLHARRPGLLRLKVLGPLRNSEEPQEGGGQNIQVVLVEPRKVHNHAGGRDESYTYIVLAGGESVTRNVTDSYESVMEAIIGYHKNRDFVAKSLSPKV